MIFTLNFVALVVLVTSVVAQEPNCNRNYTVVSGDFCDGISGAQHVSTFQLAHVNADKIDHLCDNLFAGESLCLGVKGQDCNTTTVVQSGNSCATIAASAGITASLLLQNNPNVNSTCANIYPGEVLCTSTQLIPYS